LGIIEIPQMQAQEQRLNRAMSFEKYKPYLFHLIFFSQTLGVVSGVDAFQSDAIPASPDREVRRAEAAELSQLAMKIGKSSDGLGVFTNAKAACFSCHRIGNSGGSIGPNLTEISKKRNGMEIAESLLWPNAHIDVEYQPVKLLLEDDSVVAGYVANESPSSISIKDPARGSISAIPKVSIVARTNSLSLMPDGLVNSLPKQSQADLLRFLLDLGNEEQTKIPLIEAAIKNASHHSISTFPYNTRPIDPAARPDSNLPINRNRLYDFYSKQARFFRTQPATLNLLESFPGLDGKNFGHWGSQNEETWRGEAWSKAAPNLVQCNVLVHPKKTIPRAVCFRFGEQLEWSACYNPDTFSYEYLWREGFISFSSVRHGFIDGVRIVGKELNVAGDLGPLATLQSWGTDTKAIYKGFHLFGEKVFFEIELDGKKFFDELIVVNHQPTRRLRSADDVQREELSGGPSRWPQVLETDIVLGRSRGLTVDTIQVPQSNPWNTQIACGDHGFLSDGTAIVASMQGDVFRVENISFRGSEDTKRVAKWKRIAAGLHHALGVWIHNDEIYVLGRNQITRLHDLNGDYETDWYECFSNAYITSPSGHDYICGLVRDMQGNFYTASGNQGIVQISADGKTARVIATGFRNPDGLGILPDGTITVPASEGEWTCASSISLVKPTSPEAIQPFGKTESIPFYGYRGPKAGTSIELPLLYLPRGIDNSSGGQVFIQDKRLGPLDGQIVHTSFGSGTALLLLKDRVGDIEQGGVYVLPGEYKSGVHRGKINPMDGQLYLSGMLGWGTYTPEPGCFQRLRYTGDPVQLPKSFHLHSNGVEVRFHSALNPKVAGLPSSHFAQMWNYRYSPGYGSKDYSVNHPPAIGHDRLTIDSVVLGDENMSIFLEIPTIQRCSQLHLQIQVEEDEFVDLYMTAHALDKPFPGVASSNVAMPNKLPHPLTRDLQWLQKSVANPWSKRLPKARELRIEARDNLQFSTRILEARAGETLKLTFSNPDVVPHNWALVRPGCLEKVGQIANLLVNDPDAYLQHYVPRSDDVICYTDVVEPGAEFAIHFQVPEIPGRYPYLCTFPGHWMVMYGELIVK